jgi:hypothetical protein
MDSDTASMKQLILEKMMEVVERMDAPQAIDGGSRHESLAIPSLGACAPQANPVASNLIPLPRSHPSSDLTRRLRFANHTARRRDFVRSTYCFGQSRSWQVKILIFATPATLGNPSPIETEHAYC